MAVRHGIVRLRNPPGISTKERRRTQRVTESPQSCEKMRAAVLAHVYHPEIWPEIASRLHRLDPFPWKLYVNAVAGRTPAGWARLVAKEFPHAEVFESENRGLDVGGMMNLLDHVKLDQFEFVLKIHTKRTDYDPSKGIRWRRELLDACLDDPAAVMEMFGRDKSISMIGSRYWLRPCEDRFVEQFPEFCNRFGLTRPSGPISFVAGTMFWCRAQVVQRIKNMGIRQSDFAEGYKPGGTLAHYFERLFGCIAHMDGRVVGR